MILELSLLGIVISCVYILIFNVYPGGIIVPIYFSLYLNQPKRMIATLLIAVLASLIYQFVSKRMILFGRRRFVFLMILSSFLSLLVSLVLTDFQSGISVYKSIGIFIPGLLANNILRQGLILTLVSLFTVAIILFFVFKAFFYL